jgi:hypothetical protein
VKVISKIDYLWKISNRFLNQISKGNVMKTVIKIFCFTMLFVLMASIENFSQSEGFEGKVSVKLVNDDDVSFMDYL